MDTKISVSVFFIAFRFLHLHSSVSFDHWWYKMLKIFYIFWKQNKVVCIFHLSAQVIYRRERWPLQKIWILRNKKLHLHVIMCAYRHLQTPVAINVIIYFLQISAIEKWKSVNLISHNMRNTKQKKSIFISWNQTNSWQTNK